MDHDLREETTQMNENYLESIEIFSFGIFMILILSTSSALNYVTLKTSHSLRIRF
jgi:hypothetical protein